MNGVIYVTTPDNLWAIDARTARQIWRYTYPTNDGFHIGHRGVAVYKDFVYLTTPDAHLVALDARTGKVRWDVDDRRREEGLLVDQRAAGDSQPPDRRRLRRFRQPARHPEVVRSGDRQAAVDVLQHAAAGHAGLDERRRHRRPDVDDRHLRSRSSICCSSAPATRRRCSTVPARPGDNPWTCSIVALNPDTGKLAWGFQASPHDTHDWDAAEVPVLVDATFDGAPRKLLLQASRNGYYFVLDRTTGKNLLTTPFATVNWANGVDEDGRPIPNPAKEPARDGRLVAPNEAGGTNYRSPSFDPATGLLIVSAHDAYGIYFFKPEHGAYGWAGANYTVYGRGALRAIDYQTGKMRWSHDLGDGPAGAGVLTTASGLTFTGDSAGNALALRTSDGTTLWHSGIGRVGNSPITYELDGRQYVLLGGGSALYAFALPEHGAQE